MPVTCTLLASDLIDVGADIKQYSAQRILTYAQLDRGFVVEVHGETDSGKLKGDAEAFIKSIIPVGTPNAQDPLCTARGYRVQGGIDGDTVIVVVSYIFNEVAVSATVWTFESGAFSEVLETQDEYDPTTGKLRPIQINNYVAARDVPATLLNPLSGAGIAEPAQFGSVMSPHSRKRWIYTKQIYAPADATAFDNSTNDYQGHINSEIYTGLNDGPIQQNLQCEPGTVFCYEANITFNPYQGQFIARVVNIWRPEGWQPWLSYVSPITGAVPGNVWRGKPDIPSSTIFGNGTKRATPIPTADLNDLLTLI